MRLFDHVQRSESYCFFILYVIASLVFTISGFYYGNGIGCCRFWYCCSFAVIKKKRKKKFLLYLLCRFFFIVILLLLCEVICLYCLSPFFAPMIVRVAWKVCMCVHLCVVLSVYAVALFTTPCGGLFYLFMFLCICASVDI